MIRRAHFSLLEVTTAPLPNRIRHPVPEPDPKNLLTALPLDVTATAWCLFWRKGRLQRNGFHELGLENAGGRWGSPLVYTPMATDRRTAGVNFKRHHLPVGKPECCLQIYPKTCNGEKFDGEKQKEHLSLRLCCQIPAARHGL